MKETKRAVVNTTALSLDWETFDRAQDALNSFRTAHGRIDINKHPHEWYTVADLLNLSLWATYSLGRGR